MWVVDKDKQRKHALEHGEDDRRERRMKRGKGRDVAFPPPTPVLAERTAGTPVEARASRITLLHSPAPLVGESDFNCPIQECRALGK